MSTVRSASPPSDAEARDGAGGRTGRRIAFGLLFATVLAAGWFQVHNLDIYLHARTGQWIVEHGSVPVLNVMSKLHATYPTVDDKWGFQVLAHALFDGIGPDACVAARQLLLLLLFGFMLATARGLGAGAWSSLAWLLLALVAGRSRLTFRPDLASAVFTVVFAHILLVSRRDGRGAFRLIPLQLLWVNVHGYFITGPLMLAAVAAAQLLSGPQGRAVARRLLPVGAALLGVCLLNPAGVAGALHPLAILQDLHAHEDFYRSAIVEFHPTFAHDPRQPWDRVAYLLLGVPAGLALLAAAFGSRRTRRADDSGQPASELAARGTALPALALFVLFGAMSLQLRRNMAPFAFVVAPLMAAAWSAGWQRVARGALHGALRGTSRVGRALAGAGAAGPPLAAGFALLVAWGELSDTTSIHDGLDRRSGSGLSRSAYPDAGIEFIARELPHTSVFTAFSYGSTFTGRRWPEQLASTDGNTHGYPTEYLMEVLAASSSDDASAFRALCTRDGHDVALIPMAGPLSIALLKEPEWALVCVGVREAVWVSRAAMDPAWLAEHDLLARWQSGAAPVLPDTPANPEMSWLPGTRAFVPSAEIDQATLLSRAGLVDAALVDAALVRATDATARAPHDAEAHALRGLLCVRLGRIAEAREQLQRSQELDGYNRLAEAAAKALARL